MAKKIIIDEKGNKYFWSQGDFHTPFGYIKEKDIKVGKVKTHKGNEMLVFEANFADNIERIKRGPAIILKKDAGTILANICINDKSKVVEAGSGSGSLTAFLGRISKNVTSYEIKKDCLELAQKNCKALNLNIKFKNKDIKLGIDEDDLDVVILDLPEAEQVLPHAEKSLKSGGFLVAYLPNTTQVSTFVESSKKFSFAVEKIVENIERNWKFNERIARPENIGLMHTAFLVFIRRC
ncbi:MAG TPA: methyltransferase domain-containing protein [Candidatus Nanoarchaeia archaeon]|nr:methyltransferase domain-containing protein [Candidatus Nanoarchaeia archaeon]